MTAAFTVEFVASQADVAPDLWEACFPPPLEGRWWYETLEHSDLDDQFVFRYAVLRQAGRPVGVAPLFLMDLPLEFVVPEAWAPLARVAGRLFPSLLRQRTLFVGSPCADEGHVGLLPGLDRCAALLALQRALMAQAKPWHRNMVVWKDFPLSFAPDLDRVAAAAGLFPMVSFPGTVAPLPGPTTAEFFAAMKGSRRRQLKKKLRISAARLVVEREIVRQPDEAVLSEIFGLFWQTYEHATVRFERLGRTFFRRIAAWPHAFFLLLRQADTGDLLAFMLCFDMGDTVINKYIGLDYRRPKEWSLYFRLWEALLDWAVAKGATAIQSGQTGYAPKMEMGHRLVPLRNYCRHRNRLLHWLYGAVARNIDWETLDPVLAHYRDPEDAVDRD